MPHGWADGSCARFARCSLVGTLIGVLANLGSAAAPTFEVLTIMRFASGLSLGFAAWIAWQAAFGDTEKTGDVAVVGPLVGMVMSPLIVFLLESIGLRWLFLTLALITATPLIWARQVARSDRLRPHRTRHAPTRAARAILFALGTITLGGSSVFVYSAAIGRDLDGLSPFTVSLLFSGNALAAIPSARWNGRRGPAGIWFLATAAVCTRDRSVTKQHRLRHRHRRLGVRVLHGNPRRVQSAGRTVELPGRTRRRRTGDDGARPRVRADHGRHVAGRRVGSDARFRLRMR